MRTLISPAPLYHPTQPALSLEAPLTLSRKEFLAYLPLLFQLLFIRREKSCETVAFSPGANCTSSVWGVSGRGAEGSIWSADFWWLLFCFVYPPGAVPALCAKRRREIRLDSLFFSLLCISYSL